MIQLKEVVMSVAKNYEFEFTDDDFEAMEDYLEILQPFKEHATALDLKEKFQGNESSEYIENLFAEMDRVLNLNDLKKDKFIATATAQCFDDKGNMDKSLYLSF